MLELKDLQRRYDDFALNLSFQLAHNEILTLLGASGSGKTTTLRIIAGFETADSGSILIDGRDVRAVPAQHRKIGYVFQDYTLFPHLNVADNIAYGLRAQHVPPARRRARVEEMLELVGLVGFGERSVQTLSGGEQQRVAVARALAAEPKALLLDEPFSAVDTERREDLRRRLIELRGALDVPMVFVTHSRSEALQISDRIVVLRNGQVVDQGSPEQLYEQPRSEYAARFIGRANILSGADLGLKERSRYLIRPERVRVLPTDGEAQPNDADREAVSFSGRVLSSSYYGSEREHELETPIGKLSVVTPGEVQIPTSCRVQLPARYLVELES